MTLSITKLSILTMSVMGLFETQSSETLSITALWHCVECKYAGYHILLIVMLNVVVLSDVILSVIGPLVNIFLLIQVRSTSFCRKAIVRQTFFQTPYFVDTALLSLIRLFLWHYNTQHNDNQHKDTHHKWLIWDTQHNNPLLFCWVLLWRVSCFIYCYTECYYA